MRLKMIAMVAHYTITLSTSLRYMQSDVAKASSAMRLVSADFKLFCAVLLVNTTLISLETEISAYCSSHLKSVGGSIRMKG